MAAEIRTHVRSTGNIRKPDKHAVAAGRGKLPQWWFLVQLAESIYS